MRKNRYAGHTTWRARASGNMNQRVVGGSGTYTLAYDGDGWLTAVSEEKRT